MNSHKKSERKQMLNGTLKKILSRLILNQLLFTNTRDIVKKNKYGTYNIYIYKFCPWSKINCIEILLSAINTLKLF